MQFTKYVPMYYVYTLSFEGSIFYIGSTQYPNQRLQEHLCCQDLCTGKMMHFIRYMGKTPDIKLVFHSGNYTEVLEHEYRLITHYRDIRHPLCNNDGNRQQNIIQMPCTKNLPRPKLNKEWRRELSIYLKQYQLNAK